MFFSPVLHETICPINERIFFISLTKRATPTKGLHESRSLVLSNSPWTIIVGRPYWTQSITQERGLRWIEAKWTLTGCIYMQLFSRSPTNLPKRHSCCRRAKERTIMGINKDGAKGVMVATVQSANHQPSLNQPKRARPAIEIKVKVSYRQKSPEEFLQL